MSGKNGSKRPCLVVAWTALLVTACGSALGVPEPTPPVQPRRADEDLDRHSNRSDPGPDPATPRLPRGRTIGRFTAVACLDLLRDQGVVFEEVGPESAPGVEAPLRLVGPLGAIQVHTQGRADQRGVLDCRLALGLLVWFEALQQAGVVRIDAYSTYRPGARVARTGLPSGHARALAIDIGRFHLANGEVLDVETVWAEPRRGEPPCEPDVGDSANLRLLRRLVCRAAEDEVFQIVLTPHFDDPHANHVHLEIRPDVDWTYLR